MRIRRALSPLLAVAGAVLLAGPAVAAPGDLDPSFGSGGVADLGRGEVFDLQLEPRGHVLVLGRPAYPAPVELELTKLTPTGRLDPRFGDEGVATVEGLRRAANGLVVRGFAGRIFVAGVDFRGADGFVVVLARLLPDGRPDPAFGDGGSTVVRLPEGVEPRGMLALAQRPDGRVALAVGTARDGIALARRTFGGAPDPSLGGGLGAITTGLAVGDRTAFDPEGRLLLAGRNPDEEAMVVRRILPGGRLDPGFGSGGSAVTPPLGLYVGTGGLEAAPDGGVLAAGSVLTRSGDVTSVLARLTADGVLRSGPLVLTGLEDPEQGILFDALEDVAALPDGRAVVVGVAAREGREDDWVVLAARVRPDGALDPSFGDAGAVRGPLPGRAGVVELTADGRAVLAVGEFVTPGQRRIVRLQGDTADLRLSALGAPVRSGGRVTVRLRLTNRGPHPAPAATLTLVRPPAAGGTTDRTVADLQPGQSVTTAVELALPAGTAGTLVAHARAVAHDPTPYDARVRLRLPE